MRFILFFCLLLFFEGCTSTPKEFTEAFIDSLEAQAPSVGFIHIRPKINADQEYLIIGTKFFRGIGGSSHRLPFPKIVPAGYSGCPLNCDDFTLVIPSSPGLYCGVYSLPVDGAIACYTRAIHEGRTLRFRNNECRQKCDL